MSNRISPVFAVKTMLLAALVSGLIQVAAILVTQHVLGEIVSMGPHLVWMIPLGNVLVFAIPAVILLIVTRFVPQERGRRLVVFVAAFLGFLNLTLSVPRIHQLASVILALGLAVTAMRLAAERWDPVSRVVSRATLPLAAVVALLAVGVLGVGRFQEWQAVRELPASRAGAPNVLLLVLDTVRAMNLSAYGYERPTTPALRKLSERGTLFDNALAPSSWTLPSHSSMFTGLHPFELTADWTIPLDEGYRTVAEELRDRGYFTGGFSGNLAYVNRNFGLDQGFDRFEDFTLSLEEAVAHSKLGRDLVNARWFRGLTGYHDFLGRKSAAELTDDFLSWVPDDSKRPFFGFINYFDAHEPYLPPEPYAARFVSSETERQNLEMLHMHHRAERLNKPGLTPAELQREVDAYDGGIAYADAEIGRLLEELEERGLLDNTIVIVTSDHGEQFGEHGLFEHGNSLYRPIVHVPLIMAGKGIPRGASVETPVSLRDLPATILDLAQVPQGNLPGTSLRSAWEGTRGQERLFASYRMSDGQEVLSVQEGDFYYIRARRGDELYDLRNDPREERNLVENPEAQPMAQSFKTTLDSVMQHSRGGE